MKKFLALLIGMLLFLGMTGIANALFIDLGSGLIYDTDQDLTWVQDANLAMTSGWDADGKMTWDEAQAWIDHMNILYAFGYNDWLLPTTPGTTAGFVNDFTALLKRTMGACPPLRAPRRGGRASPQLERWIGGLRLVSRSNRDSEREK